MAKEKIDIGSEDDVKLLFSYPNNFNEVGYLSQTIEQTIEIYLSSSISRDGLKSTSVLVTQEAGRIFVELEGDAADAYKSFLNRYLDAGRLGLAGSRTLNQIGRWEYNWRFFLPHGVAMTHHRTVQLLHFPPDYVLERDQDYLSAHTTLRWAALLEENGALKFETASYQNIVDIAPIAAPSNAGANLEGIYDKYDAYIKALLELWLPRTDGEIRPMVAFGGPVRGWLKENYSIDLRVLDCAVVPVTSQIKASVLAANHPSFIYNFVKQLEDDPDTPADERHAATMRVMQQDLVAARWQVLMAQSPSSDANVVLSDCVNHWSAPHNRGRICELTYEQAFNKTPSEAKKLCAALPPLQADLLSISPRGRRHRLDDLIERVIEQLGSLDGREPERIFSTQSFEKDRQDLGER